MKFQPYLVLSLWLLVASAFAESPTLVMDSLRRMQEHVKRTEALCEAVRRDPTCSTNQDLMRTVMGLSVRNCEASLRSSNCDNFIKQYPEYQNKRMSCVPYEVCKLGLQRTLVEGCAVYGYEAYETGKQFAKSTYKSTTECLASWNCWKSNIKSAGQEFGRFMTTPITELIRNQLVKDIDDTGRFANDLIDDYKKTTELQCLDPETQAEFSCYLVAHYGTRLIATRLAVGRMALLAKRLKRAAGPFGKPALPGIMRGLRKDALKVAAVTAPVVITQDSANEAKAVARRAERAEKRAATPKRWERRESVSQFRTRLAHFDPTTDDERLATMQAVFSRSARGAQVLDVENSVLKSLNDNEWLRVKGGRWTKDKDLVTVLTNQHKEILNEKMTAFAEKYKDVIDLKSYSDFKSQRFAIIPKTATLRATGLPPAMMKDLEALYRETNSEFADKLKQMGIESKVDPKTWFKAGMDANADEANLNARFARDLKNPSGGIVRSNSDGVAQLKERAFHEIAESQKSLGALPANSPILTTVDGVRLPKPEIFDLVKKSDGDAAALAATLKASYPGMEVDDALAQNLISFSKKTDSFQPGIWQSSRQVASVAEAKFGGVTIDVKGMGSNNAFQTALQAAKCGSSAFIAQCTRDGERNVTREFRIKMNAIRDVTLKNCERNGLECFVRISGDDVVVIPTNKPLPRNFARQNIRDINTAVGAGQVRQAEIGAGIMDGPNRVTLGQHGESLEKIVRSNLERGPLAERARDLTFSVKMRTVVPDIGGVQIQISGPGASGLTAADRASLIQAYRRSINDFNLKHPGERQYEFVP